MKRFSFKETSLRAHLSRNYLWFFTVLFSVQPALLKSFVIKWRSFIQNYILFCTWHAQVWRRSNVLSFREIARWNWNFQVDKKVWPNFTVKLQSIDKTGGIFDREHVVQERLCFCCSGCRNFIKISSKLNRVKT